MSLMRFGHVPERRLAELAEPSGGAAPSERERRHLDSCARCQGLLAGHRRTARLLGGTLIAVDAPKRRVGFREAAALPVTFVVAVILTGVLVLGRGPLGGGTASPSPLGSPGASQPPPSPTQVARVVTSGSNIGPVVWSPSGAALAVVVRGQDIASAEVRIFAADGAALAAYPGADVAWLDDRRFVTLEAGRRLTAGTLTLRSLDERSSVEIPGTYATSLPSASGAVAAGVAPAADPVAPPTEFVIVTANGPGKGGHGLPVAWSPDASRLVVLRDLRGLQARLAIVGYPDLTDRPIPNLEVAAAPAPVFGPDGHTLAICAAGPMRVTLLDTVTGRTSDTGLSCESGWMFWLGPAQIAAPNRDLTGLTVWNIDAATEGQPIDGATVAAASSRGVLALGQLPYGGPTITLRHDGIDRAIDLPAPLADVPVWSPDGSRLAVVVRLEGAGSDLVLLSPETGP